MTPAEIVASYKAAKYKRAQALILVDLAQRPLSEIVDILRAAGCEVRWSWKERDPIDQNGEPNKDALRRRFYMRYEKRFTLQQLDAAESMVRSGLGCRRVAAKMGINENTAKYLVHKIRKELMGS